MIIKRLFFAASLLLNLFLAFGLFFVVQRLGGLNFALHRITHDQAGLYSHRKSLFELLPPTQQAIVFLGDSQTEQCEWREFFGSTMNIINRGIVADHVKGVTSRLDKTMAENPKIIFLQVGINDLIQQQSVEKTAEDFEALIAEIRRQAPQAQLVVQSVFPVNNEVKWVGVKNETVRSFNLAIQKIAKKYALPYLDVYTPLTDGDGNLQAQYTEDGVHLNGKGYLVWKKKIEPFLN